ncbi:MAG: hypothetical protein ACRD6N_14600 [Pyrinomonadaceae bacterium]
MIIALALALLCTASGTLATYLYDEGSSFGVRVCTGACIGLAVLGLVGFVIASFLGLTPVSIALTVLVLLVMSILVLEDQNRRGEVQLQTTATWQTIRRALLHPRTVPLNWILFVGAGLILWHVFSRAVIEEPEGLSTGVLNNFGDLPFHLSVITSFVYGNNFPPEDPTYAGVKFTYPFLTDFISAIFVRCGANLRESMFIENILIAISFVGLVYRWAWVMLRDRLAATLTPLLVLLNGGLGWVLLWTQASKNEQGLFGTLKNLPPSFTIIPETTWRWGNAISTLLIPQRGMLLGLALAVIVFTQWWLAEAGPVERGNGEKGKKGKKGKRGKQPKGNQSPTPTRQSFSFFRSYPFSLSTRRMFAAGVIAGLLPLVHAHSFVVVMTMGACTALFQKRWRDWFVFFMVASVIALPQMWWSTHGSAVDAKKFLEWQFGWDKGRDTALWFWFKNTGLFIPLIIAAILWRGKEYLIPKRLLFFYLPFTLCFIVPNIMKMAPWVWDNIKVLYYWWLASAPLVALLLARLWRQGRMYRALAAALFICVTLAGALDVAAIALRSTKYQVFDRNGISFAELIKAKTQPRSLIVHAPVHNAPVFLTGRRSLMGYPGHIWTHGLEFMERESEIRRIYLGMPDADQLMRKHGIDYAVIGPLERLVVRVNEDFFKRFEKVGQVGEYSLYKIRQE